MHQWNVSDGGGQLRGRKDLPIPAYRSVRVEKQPSVLPRCRPRGCYVRRRIHAPGQDLRLFHEHLGLHDPPEAGNELVGSAGQVLAGTASAGGALPRKKRGGGGDLARDLAVSHMLQLVIRLFQVAHLVAPTLLVEMDLQPEAAGAAAHPDGQRRQQLREVGQHFAVAPRETLCAETPRVLLQLWDLRLADVSVAHRGRCRTARPPASEEAAEVVVAAVSAVSAAMVIRAQPSAEPLVGTAADTEHRQRVGQIDILAIITRRRPSVG